MSGLVLAIDGRKRGINTRLRNANTNESFIYHLYKNNYTPVDGQVIGDYTECAYPGYATQTVAPAGWSAPTDDGTCCTSTAAQQVYTATGGSAESAFGYYVTSSVDGALLWGEKFAASIDMSAAGKSTVLNPVYQQKTGTPC